MTRAAVPLLLVAIVLIRLWPTLDYDFLWDDSWVIVENTELGDVRRIPGYFVNSVAHAYGKSEHAADLNLYRPLYSTQLTLVAWLGGTSARAFRAVLLAWHLLAGLLLFRLVRRRTNDGVAFLAALAVLLHPVTMEAYLWPTEVIDPMATTFLLCAWSLFTSERDGRGFLTGLAVLAIALTKEVYLVGAAPVLLWLVWRRGIPVWRLLPSAGAALLAFGLRLNALDGTAAGDPDRLLLAATRAPLLILDGLRGIALQRPFGLRHLGLEYESLDSWVLAGAALLLTALVVAAWRMRHRWPEGLLALGVAIVMLGPVAIPTSYPTWGGYGRYIYMPAIGVAWAVALGLARVPDRLRIGAGVAVAAWFGMQLLSVPGARAVWQNDATLNRSAARAAPNAPTSSLRLSNEAMNRGDYATAAALYEELLAATWGSHVTREAQNLAVAYIELGEPTKAIAVLDRLEAFKGPGPMSVFARGRARLMTGDLAGAASAAVFGLERAPGHPDLVWLARSVAAQDGGAAALQSAADGRPVAAELARILSR